MQLGKTYVFATLGVYITLGLMFYIFVIRRRNRMKTEEQKRILEQPAIDFDQFIRDYLRAGEVKQIVHFPEENKALAILNSDAFIGGKQVFSCQIDQIFDLYQKYGNKIYVKIISESTKMSIIFF